MKNYIYRTAESVSPKHPDKLCDQISDAILDAYLRQDPHARVAVETCGGHGQVFITGEITATTTEVDIIKLVRRVTGDPNLDVHINLVAQSPEIATGVDTGGAGDQGIMIGYACNETPEMLPLEVVLAREINQRIYAEHPYDGKTQVTLRIDPEHPDKPQIDSIVASFQNVRREELEKIITKYLEHGRKVLEIHPEIKIDLSNSPTLFLNPAGDWHQGGFDADTGLTGRKLIVDNYGPRIPIGGGAFSGKDATKVDRSAAYMARKIAKDYLKSRNAKEVMVRLAYAIGHDQPLEHTVIIDGKSAVIPLGTANNPENGYDLTPQGIIDFLKLREPIFEKTARYGHFGHPNFPWEQ